MELVTSIVAGKAPGNGTSLSIALGLQGRDALTQLRQALHSTRETSTGKNPDLNFCHVEPACMFGRVMELDPLQQAPGLCGRVSLVESRSSMGVEIILHQTNVLGVRIGLINQPADAVGIVQLGPLLGHLNVTPACKRLNKEKQV